jgi:hypothetical protein
MFLEYDWTSNESPWRLGDNREVFGGSGAYGGV